MTSNEANQHAAGQHGHDHPPHLAHHFDTPEQQFESSKLGMWVFLATEILMFGGLFAAYAVYRANNPEVFLYAHHYLDVTWGAINTVILLASSFTVAWGVRAAQLGQQRLLVAMFVLTFIGGAGFMVIKGIEYTDKYDHDHGVGPWNIFHPASEVHPVEDEEQDQAPADDEAEAAGRDNTPLVLASNPGDEPPMRSDVTPPATGPEGVNEPVMAGEVERRPAVLVHPETSIDDLDALDRQRLHVFFQIYYLMTGLHGIHVLIGMGLIAWIALRSWAGHFGPSYYTPVDLTGLYWHLVDLIWIFLFPLLYLIH